MTKRHCLLIALVALGCIVIAMLWPRQSSSEHLISQRVRASFARPVVTSAKGKEFSVQFNRQDVQQQIVTVESGRNFDVLAKFPPLDAPPGTKSQSLTIVPRLTSQGEEAFQWFDARIDTAVSWSGNSSVDPHQEHPPKVPVRFHLRPGEYRVRFYLEIQFTDPEKGMSEKHLLAESSLLVTGPQNAGVVPLDDPNNKFPVD